MRSPKDSRASEAPSSTPAHWHAHDLREVLAILEVDASGLKPEAVEERRAQCGKNQFTEVPAPNLLERIFAQLKSPLALVLVVALFVTAALGEYIDSGVIAFALLIAVVVGVAQEGKASSAFKKLADSQIKRATVIRAGARQEVNADELVPGDVVELVGGVQVPADVRIIEAKKLSINEAPLTGEWQAVPKHVQAVSVGAPLAEQTNMAWMGTFVGEGHGLGVVVATGDRTAMGQLARDVQVVEEVKTPLQHQMSRVSNVMLGIIVVLVIFIFILGIFQGQTIQEMLLLSIAVAVASVPEGLPAAVTIILAVGMEALLKRGGLVRNLLAAETLGSTTYVLTDKTGTLTEGRMAISGIIVEAKKTILVDGWHDGALLRQLFHTALSASNAYRDHASNDVRGDAVERAIYEVGDELGIAIGEGSYREARVDYLAFTSDNRFAAGLSEIGEVKRLCINGAPKYLLSHAPHYLTTNGPVPLDEDVRNEFIECIDAETAQGKRLVAVAYKDGDFTSIPDDPTDVLAGIVFVGVVVLMDPVRNGVAEAIAGVKAAGAKILLITGDNPETALSIAQTVGIAGPSERALTGDDLEALSDEEILAIIERVHVFARVLPRQKMRIAQILQMRGEIVAMTGDGINDAPALRRANIGVSVGSGTEVAKEASDLVLVEDSFATIYAAIEEGRRIIANLRKVVGYLLSTAFSEVVLIGAALIVGAPAPILPAQILWANIIEEGLMGIAFAFEKGEKNAMKRRPQDIHSEGILSPQMLWFMTFVITILSMLSVALYFYFRSLNLPLEELRSVMFLAIAADSLFIAFAFRSLTTPIWKIPLRNNLFFLGSFALSATLFVTSLHIPFMREVLSYQPVPIEYVLLVMAVSLLALFTIELGKFLFFEKPDEVVE